MGLTKPRAAQIFNLDYKQSTRVVTTTNITLSGGAPNSVDGINLSLNDRVLVTGQSTGSQNGLYLVTTLGSGSNGTWARTSDGNENGEIEAGMIVMVTEGTIYADTQWKLITDDPIVINTTALTFTQNYMANSISGGTSNVVVNSNANVTISSAGTANVLTISNTGAFVSGVASASGNITGGNILTAGLISAAGNIQGGNILGNGRAMTGILFSNTSDAATANLTVDDFYLSAVTALNVTNSGAMSYLFDQYPGNNPTIYAVAGSTLAFRLAVTGHPFLIQSSGANYSTGLNHVTTSGTVTTGASAQGQVAGTLYWKIPGNISGTYTYQCAIHAMMVGNILISDPATVSVNGNVTGGNVLTAGLVSATGNVTGNYFIGNGSQLTGVVATPTSIVNGTSNVVVASSANVTVGVTGNNIATFTANGLLVTGVVSGSGNVTGSNVLTAGLISATSTITSAANVTGGNITTAGVITATGNVTGGNVLTAGLVSATGNVTGGNLIAGTGASGNITGANVITANTVTATANITAGNLLTTGLISATSTITSAANVVGGNITTAGLITATGNVTGGNILTAGIMSSTGNVTGGNISTAGLITATGNIQGGNIRTAGLISATSTITAAANITGGNILTVGQVSATGNVSGNFFVGNGAFLTGITGGGGSGGSNIANGATVIDIPVSSGNIAMSVAGQSNTVVINLGSLTMYGTFAGPKTLAANVSVANAVNALLLGPVTIDDGYNITVPTNSSLSTYGDASPDIVGSTVVVSGNITGGNLLTAGLITATGNVTGFNILTAGLISATGNITGGNITTAGNITGNNIFTSGNILPTANATANIGSSSFQYNTIFARATSAQYADLAENYEADATYEPGTVLCFGGPKEVTVCNVEDCTRVAGVVSTNPGHLMNSGQTGTHVASLALQGRVPTRVTGQVRKGDLMVSAGHGRAKTNNEARAGTIIGKALANSEGDTVIEVVVGRD